MGHVQIKHLFDIKGAANRELAEIYNVSNFRMDEMLDKHSLPNICPGPVSQFGNDENFPFFYVCRGAKLIQIGFSLHIRD